MSNHRTATTRRGAVLRRTVAGGALMVAATGLTACSDSAGPEAGAVTTEDLQSLEDQVTALEDRVGTLEEGLGADGGMATDDGMTNEGFYEDPMSLVGQQVTVSGAVSELITLASDTGSAFRIAGETGDAVPVLSTDQSVELQADDTVQVTGTVVEVQQDTFEQDFGVAADGFFEDPDAFFETAEGQPAISADTVEVLQEQSEE